MRTLTEYKQAQSKEAFFGKLFEARDVAHVLHLQTKSYAEHKALNSFYEDILSFIDTFIETYQGQYGIINSYGTINLDSGSTPVNYINNFVSQLKESREKFFNDNTHLQNIIDEMIALSYQTIYKLKNLS